MNRKLLLICCILSIAWSLFAQNPSNVYPNKNLYNKWGYFTRGGTAVTGYIYDEALGFSEGLAAVKKNGKWGYINENGQEVIPLKYDQAWFFTERYAAVKLNGLWGYIDHFGKVSISYQFDDAADFSEGLAWVRSGSKIGYINTSGTVVIGYNYSAAGAFENGTAPVQKGGSWGYINKSGETVVSFQYQEAHPFAADGLAAVKLNGYWGYIDSNGTPVTKFTYYEPKEKKDQYFGWDFAQYSYEQDNTSNLEKALAIIEKNQTYYYGEEYSKLEKYYKKTGNYAKADDASQKYKEYKRAKFKSSLEGDNLGLSAALVPGKLLAMGWLKQFTMYGELRVKKTALAIRYNSYSNYEDFYRFKKSGDSKFTYSGREISGIYKNYFEKHNYNKEQGYWGIEYRNSRYDCSTMQNVYITSLQRSGNLTPTIGRNDVSLLFGISKVRKFWFYDFFMSLGIGKRSMSLNEPITLEEASQFDSRLTPDRWESVKSIYLPCRMGFRLGVNLF